MRQEFISKVGELVGVWAAFHPSNVAALLLLPAITGSCLDDDDISLQNGILNLSDFGKVCPQTQQPMNSFRMGAGPRPSPARKIPVVSCFGES